MKYFGTDGIRQEAEKFNQKFLSAVVKGLVDYAGDNVKVLIAGDTRESTEWMLMDLEVALETFGIEYGNAGVLPTPAIHYCFSQMGFNLAIDVTASHNPDTDNGIKIFELSEQGPCKLSKEGRERVEKALIERVDYSTIAPSLREDLHQEAVEIYMEHLRDYVGEANLAKLNIGMDCANGAMSVVGAKIFEELGAEVEVINTDVNYGAAINDRCGSTHLEDLQKLVKEQGLDFGVAFDGDGDRCMLIDETGEVVDGDQILAILANFLGLRTIATTVMANQGLINWAQEDGLIYEVTAVGDSNVTQAMREKQLEIGGEQSGHIILPGEPTGDGMLTALMVAKAVAKEGKSLGELKQIMHKSPQVMVNLAANAKQKQALEEKNAQQVLNKYEEKVAEIAGRLLVRPSGTEDLIRITMWGNDAEEIKRLAEELKTELEQIL